MRFLCLGTTIAALSVILGACGNDGGGNTASGPSSLKQVPAVRLNYRYEADVPPPDAAKNANTDERSAAVQGDFDQNRSQEVLDKSIFSPDRKRILAVYHRAMDAPAEFRLDMYTGDGKILKKITPDTMAVHFPDTIRWSPDSSTVAFVAMVRVASADVQNQQLPVNPAPDVNAAETNANVEASPAATPPLAPANVLTFRTEQLYICSSEGEALKPVTQNEGLIYFYYVWSPDSTALAALAATNREWQVLNQQADLKGEVYLPVGRPRMIEKNGRERRLDDAMTTVQPVWSPDSSKIAVAYDKQIRIYDAAGNPPTQAAIPLRNNLLLSSQAYDREQQAKLDAANAQANVNTSANGQANATQAAATLPDESSLVSFNPSVLLNWTADDLLYFQTAFVKRMKNETDSVTSFPRWHRLVLSPQPATAK